MPAEESQYANQWEKNAKQHYNDGDYSWICEELAGIAKPEETVVLELGCGTGYSTLSLAQKGFRIISIDALEECIWQTAALLSHSSISNIVLSDRKVAEAILDQQVVLLCHDFVNNAVKLLNALAGVSASYWMLCNPGGNLSPTLSDVERKLLTGHGFAKELIETADMHYLHKWAIIYRSCWLSSYTGIPLLYVDRCDDKKDMDYALQIMIGNNARMEVNQTLYRKIRNAPSDGIKISGDENADLFWSLSLMYPKE